MRGEIPPPSRGSPAARRLAPVIVALAAFATLGGGCMYKPPAFAGTAERVYPAGSTTATAAGRLHAWDGAALPSGHVRWFRFASEPSGAGGPVRVASVLLVAAPHDDASAVWSTARGDLRAWLIDHEEPVAADWRERLRQDEAFRLQTLAFFSRPSAEPAPRQTMHPLTGTVRPRDRDWATPEMDVDLSAAAAGARPIVIRGSIRSPIDPLMSVAWPVLTPAAMLGFFPPQSWSASHP